MWQPHTKVNTQRGKRVLSLGGLFCGASGARPPSLGCFLWGFSLFLALEVPSGDHSLKDSQQSVVHHERAPTPKLVELFGGTPARSSVSTRLTALDNVTSWEEASAGVTSSRAQCFLRDLDDYCHLNGEWRYNEFRCCFPLGGLTRCPGLHGVAHVAHGVAQQFLVQTAYFLLRQDRSGPPPDVFRFVCRSCLASPLPGCCILRYAWVDSGYMWHSLARCLSRLRNPENVVLL